MAKLIVVAGAQFGSEGKGAVAAHLSQDFEARDVAIRVAGPNAGHTAYAPDGKEWKLRSVPVAAVSNLDCQLHIAAGSEIDYGVLMDEIQRLDADGHNVSGRLTVHPSATIILDENLAEESRFGLVGRIGSTGKGIGSARAGRIMRIQPLAEELIPTKWLGEPGPFPLDDLNRKSRILIEGTQGYGLGLHTRFYPHVTSSDCRAIDFLAMSGISPWGHELDIYLVARTYPIRVAGNSGPLQDETTWEALGLPAERTTVTNKVRRVGGWDSGLVREAILANGGPDDRVQLVLTMLDHRFPSISAIDDYHAIYKDADVTRFISEVERHTDSEVALVGTGPQTMVAL